MLNKDGLEGGSLVSPKEHQKAIEQKRLAAKEKKAKPKPKAT